MPPVRHRVRHRTAAAAAAGLLAAAPLLVAGAAYAQPTPAPTPPESGKEVVFSGGKGLLGVTCAANPSASSVTVPAETTLRVVNRTGYRAKLLIDGATQGEIADGGAAPVVFRRGPVTLGLKPSCMIGQESAVRVEVTSPGTAATTGGKPGSQRPARPASGYSTGDADRNRPQPHPSTTGVPTAGPSASASASPEAALTSEDSGSLMADDATVDGSATGADSAAAEALASVEPIRESGPIGLLALIATVCVIGVSAGAIRAIIAQRASRTGVA